MYSTALIDPKQATAEKETLKHHANSLLVAKLKQESPDNDTPELRLIRLTMEHPGFSLAYSFPSLDEYFPSEDYSYPSLEYDWLFDKKKKKQDWFISDVGMKTSKVMNSLDMIAVDCEMVLCEDGREGLVRVGAVDRNLKRVLQPFLSNGSILVGHSLNKDMRVLKIDHPKVIDTALVFNFSHARESRKPSLNDLYKAIFGGEVRVEGASHNCVHDAAAAMKIALAFIKKPFDTTITRSEEILEAEKSKLFIHRIRSYVPSEELNLLLAEKFGSGKFKLDVKPAKTGRRHYCAVVVFDSSQEADQAFANVGGNEKTDSYGYPQKLIDLSRISLIGVTCFVRKMV